MKATLSAIALCTLAGVAGAQEQPVRADVDAAVEPYVGGDAPGIAVLVTRNGKVLHMKGYGYADLETKIPVDEKTVFDLASVSKQMTDLALMLLVEEGALKLETPVKEVLPAFRSHGAGWRPLMIGDLVRHLAGLPDYLDAGDGFEYTPATTNEEVVAWLAGRPLRRAPGTQFEYSNSAYIVLASAIAARAGKASLAEILAARVFAPLGMKGTGVVVPVDPKRVAKGYAGTDGAFTPSFEPYVVEGDGGVLSSIEDLARYEAALVAHSLLDAEATRALCETGTMDDGSPLRQEDGAGYGFGWSIEAADGQDYCWHSGGWYGVSTAYVRNLTSGDTVIVLANGEAMSSTELAFQIEEIVR